MVLGVYLLPLMVTDHGSKIIWLCIFSYLFFSDKALPEVPNAEEARVCYFSPKIKQIEFFATQNSHL